MFRLRHLVTAVVFASFISTSSALSTNLAESVALGAAMAIDHCQKMFQWDKWNCPESSFSRTNEQPANREIAYARAIVAAGIVHTITKNCSHGQIEGCGCNNVKFTNTKLLNISKNGAISNQEYETLKVNEGLDWSWGCSDYLDYGDQIARNFLDDLDNGNDSRSLVHLHNNLVGREIVKQTMIKKCVCHGMSGSCSLQTCWLRVAPFPIIAEKLKERYQKALYIQEDDAEIENNAISTSISERMKQAPSEKLVYLSTSPDYCVANEITGTNGTRGRTCSRSKLKNTTKAERRSCKNICKSCGYKVRKQKRQLERKCECKFHWCCEVKCSLCTETIEEYYCI